MAITPKAWTTQPRFFTFNGRRLFGLLFTPTGQPCRGTVLYLAPLAEEMNRCRWQAASLGRALAARGQACLILDPHGCGESEGRTGETDWSVWLADARTAVRWLADTWPDQPVSLWGVRLGALMAVDLATRLAADAVFDTTLPVPQRLLLWQPVVDGATFLNQYLRLRLASQLVHSGDKETTESLRARLLQGEAVEVAGYPLTGGLASSMAAVRMAECHPAAQTRVDWIEVVAKPEQGLGLPSRKQVDRWQQQGLAVNTRTVVCPPIWQTYERERAPALEAATLDLWEAAA